MKKILIVSALLTLLSHLLNAHEEEAPQPDEHAAPQESTESLSWWEMLKQQLGWSMSLMEEEEEEEHHGGEHHKEQKESKH